MNDSVDYEVLGFEYEKAKQLVAFKRLCLRMSESHEYALKIKTIYRQSMNETLTTQALFNNELGYKLNPEDSARMATWMRAHLSKKPSREPIPQEAKSELVQGQEGLCAICGDLIDELSSSTHVDHIIPWELVGDELEDNYQALCEKCNLKKNNDVSFIFKSLIGLV